MAQSSYDINQVPPDDETPSVRRETEHAKLYLRKFCPEAGDSLYNHLSEVLSKIIAERPRNALASFEEYSKKLRNDKFRSQNDRLRDLYVAPPQYEEARKLIDLFKIDSSLDEDNRSFEEEREDGDKRNLAPNLFDDMYYFEQVDIGLPRSEIVLLNLSIRKLMAKEKIEDVRFWGKILGRPKNYYIVEATLSEDEIERRLQELEGNGSKNEEIESIHAEEKKANERENAEKEALESALATELPELTEENKAGSIVDDGLKLVFPDIPKNTWKPTPEVAPEKLGTGANAKVYYVCNSPGLDDWTELPTVTPQQIVVARQIVHLFTGNLETPIHTFPLFPGNEKNYLRAQIARIGAATHVSPIGYFTFGDGEQEDEEIEEDEDEEEEEEDGEIVKNRHYEQPALKDLIDPSMSNWCHHSPYILNQGRLEWLAPGKVNNEDDDEDGDEEGEEDEEEGEDEDEGDSEEGESGARDEGGRDKGFEKEIGPPLLTPLSEDAYNSDSVTPAPWTPRQSSTLQPDIAVALIRSNVWPGAFAFAANKKFANLYIGWGHKHHAYNYSPPAMPAIQEQYAPIDSEITEIQEPSFDEEEAYRLAHLPPPAADDTEEQQDEEETDEEDDDEENDGED